MQGKVLDGRRRLAFRWKRDSLVRECDELGLFQARIPRFSQLFFYNFSQEEEATGLGQPFPSPVSIRAGRSYLRSGRSLQSKCGVSDVWFHYVENNPHLFKSPGELPSSPKPVLAEPQVNPSHLPAMYKIFQRPDEYGQSVPMENRNTTASAGTRSSDSSMLECGASDYEVHSLDGGEASEDDGLGICAAGERGEGSAAAEDSGVGEMEQGVGGNERFDEDVDEFDFGNESIPTNLSFQNDLAKALAGEGVDILVPSSVPEEWVLRRPGGTNYGPDSSHWRKPLMQSTGQGAEKARLWPPMEGVEPIEGQGSLAGATGILDDPDEGMAEGKVSHHMVNPKYHEMHRFDMPGSPCHCTAASPTRTPSGVWRLRKADGANALRRAGVKHSPCQIAAMCGFVRLSSYPKPFVSTLDGHFRRCFYTGRPIPSRILT